MASSSVLSARDLTRATVLAAHVEVADGLWAKFMGLMGRASLPAGGGLWLPDSNGIHMMFMRFPIDVVFLGAPRADGASGAGSGGPEAASAGSGAGSGGSGAGSGDVRAVLAIRRALPAWRGLVPLVRGARGVLELPVGAIDAAGVEIGDLIELAREEAVSGG